MPEDSYHRYFPYEDPYDHQEDAMRRIYEALQEGRDMLFEGATGTGKTLASLVPALEVARETDRTVVITTNVHQQMRQFRRDAKAIAETTDLKAVVFRGKGSMCHIDVGYQECQALRETTRELVDTDREQATLANKAGTNLENGGDSAVATPQGDASAGVDSAHSTPPATTTSGSDTPIDDRSTCDYYTKNLTADTSDFFDWLYRDVRTPDEIYEFAEMRGFCGYELLKEAIESVDLVVCNYHHLLDPAIREQFFRWLGADPDDIITIFDEAHNIESAARDHARQRLTETTVARALDELGDTHDSRTEAAQNVLSAFLDALLESYEAAVHSEDQVSMSEDWTDILIANDDRRDELTLAFLRSYSGPGYQSDLEVAIELGRELDDQYEQAFKNGETTTRQECPTLQAAYFVESWLDASNDEGTHPVVSVRQGPGGDAEAGTTSPPPTNSDTAGPPRGNDGGAQSAVATEFSQGTSATPTSESKNGDDIYGRAELYTCIPERVTSDLFDAVHASVLMSATLRPFDVTADVLGLSNPETMAYGAQFPEEHRRTYAVDGPALFARNRDDRSVQETVTSVLENVGRFTPGNTLVFFPSYAEAARYHDRVSVGTRYLDEPGSPARELRESFTDDEDGMLFTSLWGTLGEGVSYEGDDARAVVVVGVPYPRLDNRMEAIEEAYDVIYGQEDKSKSIADGGRSDSPGWRYAVEIPTVRKTRQALGRVIRSPEDFGARILLDARYTGRASVEMPAYGVRGSFPPAERDEIIDIDPEKLGYGLLNFFTGLNAYAGDPPNPQSHVDRAYGRE